MTSFTIVDHGLGSMAFDLGDLHRVVSFKSLNMEMDGSEKVAILNTSRLLQAQEGPGRAA